MPPVAGNTTTTALGVFKPEFIDETLEHGFAAGEHGTEPGLPTGWQPEQIAIAALAALEVELPRNQQYPAGLTILLTSNDRIQDLNNRFRGKDRPTNVLSFPDAAHEQPATPAQAAGEDRYIGDIAIAIGVLTDEADRAGIAVSDHLAHLVMHGTLHLLGYDHERSKEEARQMEQIEIRALLRLGIANPYE